jgi:hypothetical protein
MPQRKRDGTAPPSSPAKPPPARESPPTKKSPRARFDFDPSEWTPVETALGRIRESAASREVAQYDLLHDVRSGKLPSARRWFDPRINVELGCERLRPADWAGAYIQTVSWDGTDYNEVRGLSVRPGCRYGYYVSRACLDQRYPPIGASSLDLDPAPPTAFEPKPPPPRKRGPATVHDWCAICGEIARRCLDPTGRVAVPENESRLAGDMLGWCGAALGREPAESEMREAVKRVCAALRQGPDAPHPKTPSR